MATQEQSTQETPEAEKPAEKRSRANTPDQSQPEQASTNDPNLEFGQVLQQQIAEAVQPVLAEFRQQVARAVQEQLESESGPERNGQRLQEGSNHTSQALAAESERDTDDSKNDAAQKALDATAQSQASEPASNAEDRAQIESRESQAEPGEQSQDATEAEDSTSGGLRSALSGRKALSVPNRLLSGGVHLAEQQGERWLQSMVAAGLTSLLAESSKTAAQQRAEQELHALLTKGFEALPDGTLSTELQGQIERTLQGILRDTIEALFSEDVRTNLVEKSSEAVGAAVHRDFEAASDSLKSAAIIVVEELVRVLRRQWQRVLRLIFKAVLAALESSVGDDDDNAVTSTSKKSLSAGGDGD